MRNSFFISVVFAAILVSGCKKDFISVDCNFTSDELLWLSYDTSSSAPAVIFKDENDTFHILHIVSKTYSETQEQREGYVSTVRKWEIFALLDTHVLSVILKKQNTRSDTREYCKTSCFLTVNTSLLEIHESSIKYADQLDTIMVDGNPCPHALVISIHPDWIVDLEHIIYSREKGFAELNFPDGHCYVLQP